MVVASSPGICGDTDLVAHTPALWERRGAAQLHLFFYCWRGIRVGRATRGWRGQLYPKVKPRSSLMKTRSFLFLKPAFKSCLSRVADGPPRLRPDSAALTGTGKPMSPGVRRGAIQFVAILLLASVVVGQSPTISATSKAGQKTPARRVNVAPVPKLCAECIRAHM